ncbi:MAG TPA: lysophospholipid acyltransferase family protein [Candidatus Atribacteria bacterium]|nr:lysophospholipid acyltransferase family protein [Candidatus Atribacteria bacterium]
MIYYICKYLAIFLLKVFFSFRVKGVNHIPRQGPCILVANHSSNLDPIVLGCASSRRVHFVAKEELFRNPLASFFLRRLGAFPLHRGEGDKEAVKRIFSLLKEGKVVGLFPEGTRNQGELGTFQRGALKLLLRAEVPVVVAGIRGTYESLPRGKKIPRPFPIQVTFSPPFEVKGWSVEEVEKKIREEMEALLSDEVQ